MPSAWFPPFRPWASPTRQSPRPRRRTIRLEPLEPRDQPALAPGSIAFSDYDQATNTYQIDVYDPGSGTTSVAAPLPQIQGETSIPWQILPTASGRIVVTTSSYQTYYGTLVSGQIYVVDAASHAVQTVTADLDSAHPTTTTALPDGRAVYSHYDAGTKSWQLCVYDSGAGKVTKSVWLPATAGTPTGLVSTPAGQVVLSMSGAPSGSTVIPGRLYLFNPDTGKLKATGYTNNAGGPKDLTPLPDGRIGFDDIESPGGPVGRFYDPDTGKVSGPTNLTIPGATYGYGQILPTAGGAFVVTIRGYNDYYYGTTDTPGKLYLVDPAKAGGPVLLTDTIPYYGTTMTALSDGGVAWVDTPGYPTNYHTQLRAYNPVSGSTVTILDPIPPGATGTWPSALAPAPDGEFVMRVYGDYVPNTSPPQVQDPGRIYLVDPAAATADPVVDLSPYGGPAAVVPRVAAVHVSAVEIKPTGDLTFKYRVQVPELDQDVPINLYWSTAADPTTDDLSKPILDSDHAVLVKQGTKFGKSVKIPIKADLFTTAPAGAKALVIVSDPEHMLDANGQPDPDWVGDRVDVQVSTDLKADQLRQIMGSGNITQDDAQRLAPLISQYMDSAGIESLEQRAMFLGQVAVETNRLKQWAEGGSKEYFITNYWMSLGKWKGLQLSRPTPEGLRLRIPGATAAVPHKAFDLY